MPRRFDPAHRAAELRALIEQVSASARRAHGADHPLRGKVCFNGGVYVLRHLGAAGSSTVSAAEAMLSWCRAAHREADRLDAPAPRLPQAVRP
jgi:hypothetical protein